MCSVKKIIFIVLFLFTSFLIFSNPIRMDYSLELGWIPNGAFGGYETEMAFNQYDNSYYRIYNIKGYNHWNSFYTELKTKIWVWNTLFAGGGITIQMHKADGISFDPDFSNYNFIAGVKWNNIEVFYSHDCTHPQMAYNEFYRVTSLWGEGVIDRFGIKISNK